MALDLKQEEEELSKLEAEYSLHEFLKQAWSHIEGSIPFVDNWHLEAIAIHLEACYRRKIKNLIINVPPRTSKTTLVSVVYPVWVWLQNPQEKFMFASYANSLAMEHSVKSRRLIESNWFQSRWGKLFQLTKDQNTKKNFENNKKGYRISTSVGSSVTGSGASTLITDDPNHAGEGLSQVKREAANSWWDQVWSTRLNDPKKDVKIVVQQRIHEKDITGHILENDSNKDWVTLILPMEFEIKRKCQTFVDGKLFWEDPRTIEGELLVKDRFSEKEIKRYKRELGSYGFAGQMQQRPAPLEGGILQKTWFKKWDKDYYPKFELIIQSWDTAFSDKPDAAYSACTTWGVFYEEDFEELATLMLLSTWRARVGYPELRDRAQRLYKNYTDIGEHKAIRKAAHNVDVCLIEAKATGDPLLRDLRKGGIPARGFLPKGDKNSRVQRVSPFIESGCVYLIADPKHKEKFVDFSQGFLDIIATFPNSDSRDYVDTMTQVMEYLRDANMLLNKRDKNINYSS